MRTREQLETAWLAGAPSPRGWGTVRLIVVRRGGNEHEVVSRGELTVSGGLVGDRWRDGPRHIDRQLTLMEARVATVVADGQPLHLPGDNLLVDFDLSTHALPPGTRLRLGTAVLAVSAVPHTGCKKFKARFGADALAWINDPAAPERRLRGINCSIVQPGVVWVSDTVETMG